MEGGATDMAVPAQALMCTKSVSNHHHRANWKPSVCKSVSHRHMTHGTG